MAISRRLRLARPVKRRVSKKISQKKYPFEIKVSCNIKPDGKYDYEDSIDVEDVSKLPKKIKDQFNKALLKLETYSSNHTEFTKVVYGKGKDYISLMGYAEHPLDDDMSGNGTLGSWINALNNKSIWQYFGTKRPTHDGKAYEFSSICLAKPKGLIEKKLLSDYC